MVIFCYVNVYQMVYLLLRHGQFDQGTTTWFCWRWWIPTSIRLTRIAMASELDCLVLGHSHTHRIHGADIYANIWGILMVNVTIYRYIYSIHGSYGICKRDLWALSIWIFHNQAAVFSAIISCFCCVLTKITGMFLWHPNDSRVTDFHQPTQMRNKNTLKTPSYCGCEIRITSWYMVCPIMIP